MRSRPQGLNLVQLLRPSSLIVQPTMNHELRYRECRAWVCRVGSFSQGIPFFRISISANKPRFSGSPTISIVDSPASYLQSASYMGEAARGHCELVFARGEVCQNSTPSTGSFSCAASSPSLLVRSTRHASRTTVPSRQGMGCRVGGFSQGIPFFRISISANKPRFLDSPAISIVDSPASHLQPASCMGEAARGHCELVFARGEVCQKSTPSTGSFSCAASSPPPPPPPSFVQLAMHQELQCQASRAWAVV
jgi:hypothetical protein